VVTVDVNENKRWEVQHRHTVGACVMFRKLVDIAGPVAAAVALSDPAEAERPSALDEAEYVSAYPTLDDLPRDGWVWYDEREGTDPITDTERASNA
jgi:hypothetical protein